MKNKYHANITFKCYDIWFGVFIDKDNKALYICLIPMLPIKIWITEHKACPVCGSLEQKVAIDTGDGWGVEWECKECYNVEEMDWAFGDKWMTSGELEKLGYEII